MTTYREEDLLPLSGLQHFTFCRRQWALIHLEQQWQENLRTVEGALLHRRAHDGALLERRGYSMLYVVNPYRELEPDPEEDAALLERIQQSARLRVTYLVNNANLGPETTPQLVREAAPYLGELSRITGIPVLWTAVESRYAGQFPPDGILPIEVYVKLPWDEEEKR